MLNALIFAYFCARTDQMSRRSVGIHCITQQQFVRGSIKILLTKFANSIWGTLLHIRAHINTYKPTNIRRCHMENTAVSQPMCTHTRESEFHMVSELVSASVTYATKKKQKQKIIFNCKWECCQ